MIYCLILKNLSKKSEDSKVLSLSASIYDPLGMISPITSQIKTLFRSLCVDRSDWGEVVSGDVRARWFVPFE